MLQYLFCAHVKILLPNEFYLFYLVTNYSQIDPKPIAVALNASKL